MSTRSVSSGDGTPPEPPDPPQTSGGSRPGRSPRRRAALIATALSVPVVVLLAFAFTAGQDGDNSSAKKTSSGVLTPLAVTAPPALSDAQAADCTKVVAGLPVTLASLAPRTISPPAGPYVAAWGNPAVIMRCGVGRPAALHAGSDVQVYPVNDVAWLQTKISGADVFVAIDRAVYVEVTVPMKITLQPLPIFADAIAKALPVVCQLQNNTTGAPVVPDSQLCTHRP